MRLKVAFQRYSLATPASNINLDYAKLMRDLNLLLTGQIAEALVGDRCVVKGAQKR